MCVTMISFICYDARPIQVLKEIFKEEKIDGLVLTDRECVDKINTIKKSEVIFVFTSSLPDECINVLKNIDAKIISYPLEELNNVDKEVLIKARKYYIYGGKENLRNLVKFLINLSGKEIKYDEPKKTLISGIYHPELGVTTSKKKYLEKYVEKYGKRPLVGIIFWRNEWLYDDLTQINMLIKYLENEGLGVIPIFTYTKDPVTGIGMEKMEVIKKFLFEKNRPIVDAIISLISFGIKDFDVKKLNVPIFSPLRSWYQSIEEWKNENGVDYLTQVYGVILPETKGAIEPIFIGGRKNKGQGYEPNIKYFVKKVKNWIKLRKKPRKDIKIAIVLISPPCKGLEGNIGVGMGLDVPESVVKVLRHLKKNGYKVKNIPENGEELIKMVLNKRAISEFRWTSVEDIVSNGGAVDFVGKEYINWFKELPKQLRKKIIKNWGSPDEVLKNNKGGMIYNNKFVIPGIKFGNVLLTTQPKFGCEGSKCDGKTCKILHDPNIVPPHHWWAFYKWISKNYDILIHFGTHGSLEFRPGKGVGLSPACVPEASIGEIPHVYVYIVSNPMEGVIAKRRSYATIVDHLHPPMKYSENLEELDSLIKQYVKARNLGDKKRKRIIYENILDKAKKENIKIKSKEEKKVIEELHEYLEFIRNSEINVGLHIFATPPEDPKILSEYVFTAMSHDTSLTTSINKVLLESLGFDYNNIINKPLDFTNGVMNKEISEKVCDIGKKLLKDIISNKKIEIVKKFKEEGFQVKNEKKIRNLLNKAADLSNRIKKCKKEIKGLIKALNFEFVEPGPSGSLARGKYEIIPTGRNFYAVDPTEIPTKAAWKIGVKTAEKLLKFYKNKYGKFPETVGQVLWSIDGYKADGEQLSQILYLLGVKPKWKNDKVVGVEVIPLNKLKRPRIDVLVRISGITRDTLPNYIEIIDEAVKKVIKAKEPLHKNYVKKHYIENLKELSRMGVKRAKEFAKYRIFSTPPGAYGAGVNYAVESSAWKNKEELGKIWIKWSDHAYSKDRFGVKAPESLTLNLRKVDVITRNHVSDEHELTNCCGYFAFQGGFKAAVDTLRGKKTETLQVDTRDISNIKVINVKKEIERIVRSKLLNDEWIKNMKKHGYRGANEFSKKILHLYGWQSTTGLVDDWVFDNIFKKYSKMKEWFKKHNPYALEEITRRLLEAYERKLWKADKKTIRSLKHLYMEIESTLEDEVGKGEIQGGIINIYSINDVDNWKNNMKKVEKVWNIVKGN